MKAVIMAGGLGTRLRPLTSSLPKPMIPMVNRPMMEHILLLLKQHGFTKIICLLYHQSEAIKNYFQNGSKFAVEIQYVEAEADYGTAGAVKNAEELIKGERFLIISGDVLTDFNLSEIVRFHIQKKAQATMALTRVRNPLDYGIVITDEEGRIVRFLEKPTWGEVFSDTINTGIYLLEPEVLELIPLQKEFDFSKNLYPLMLKRNDPLYGFIAEGYWRDVGNIEEYRRAHQDVLHGDVTMKIQGTRLNLIGKDIWVGDNSRIDAKHTQLKGAVVIGKRCRIKESVRIYNSVIGDDSIIEEDVVIRNSILWNNVRVSRDSEIIEAIVADHCEIGEKVIVQENAVISSECRLGAKSEVKSNVKLWPGKSVEEGAVLSTSLVWGDRWLKEFFSDARVTGLANIEVTPEFAAKLGAAFGAYLGKGSYVLTSRDSHPSSRMVNRALICGLLSAGVNVEDLRSLPIPLVRYQLKSGKEKAGLHTRKSPFDEKLTDILFFDTDGKDLPPAKVKSVERLFLREDFHRAAHNETGNLDFPVRIVESYKEGLFHHIDAEAIRQSHLKVIIDYAYGSASEIFPAILGAFGLEVIALNAFIDPSKLTKTKEDFDNSLKQLSNIVHSLKAQIGFLFDTGAEKIFLLNERGEILDGDLTLALVTLLVLKGTNIKKIAVPVNASRTIEEMAERYGVQVKRIGTDTRSMMDVSSEVGFVGTKNGGFIFPEFQPAFDAMLTVCKILELMGKCEETLGDLQKEVPKTFILRQNLPCPMTLKGTILRRLIEETKTFPYRELIDGVKLHFDRDWIQIIPDSTRSFFHINAESAKREKAEALIEEYKSKIEQWLKEEE
ncbi:MAG: sugar phosphate nucleotidyltransferase [Candidatus Edwardsbacteria bacterium]